MAAWNVYWKGREKTTVGPGPGLSPKWHVTLDHTLPLWASVPHVSLVISKTLSSSFHASLELHLKHIQVIAFTFHKGVCPANSTWPL